MKGTDLALPFGIENAQETHMPSKNALQLVTQSLTSCKALSHIKSVDPEKKQPTRELS